MGEVPVRCDGNVFMRAAPTVTATKGSLLLDDIFYQRTEGVDFAVAGTVCPPFRKDGAEKVNVFFSGDGEVWAAVVIDEHRVDVEAAVGEIN